MRIKSINSPVQKIGFLSVLIFLFSQNYSNAQGVMESSNFNSETFDDNRKEIKKSLKEGFKNHENVKIENVRALNTRHLDFSPAAFGDGIIFSSTRGNAKELEVVDSWTNDNFSDLFYSEYDDTFKKYKKPIPLNGELNKQFHDGVATFDQSGTVMFFTRNNNNGKSQSKKGLVDLKIYGAFLINDRWANVFELPFNSNEFTSCHPTISKDGNRLYFASNRPGGYGGLDIYVSEKKEGLWHEPQNLGPTVNSAKNEIFPVIHQDETLYFSSNGHAGLGGLDIFLAKKTDSEDENSWGVRENLGTPYNSTKDDFGYVVIDKEKQSGFLTSNRKGGEGKDDIYSWKIEGTPISKTICVYDIETGNRIPNANVLVNEMEDDFGNTNEDFKLTLEPMDGAKDKYVLGVEGKRNDSNRQNRSENFKTSEEGFFDFKFMPHQSYNVVVEKNGYQKEETTVDFNTIKKNDKFCIAIKKGNDRPQRNVGTNSGWNSRKKPIRTKASYGDDPTVPVVTYEEVITIIQKTELRPVTTYVPISELMDSPNINFSEVNVISLKDIFYNFNKYEIRADASLDLGHVYTLLQKYPSLEIELMAHTDSRGTHEYNTWLSNERAKSARQFLLKKGIDPSRVTAVGYGETQLKNNCRDGVECSEKEHQQNRRTEVKVTKFNSKNGISLK